MPRRNNFTIINNAYKFSRLIFEQQIWGEHFQPPVIKLARIDGLCAVTQRYVVNTIHALLYLAIHTFFCGCFKSAKAGVSGDNTEPIIAACQFYREAIISLDEAEDVPSVISGETVLAFSCAQHGD